MIKIVLDSQYQLDGLDPNSAFVLTMEDASFETITQRGSSFSNLVEFAKTASNISFFGLLDNPNTTVRTPYQLYDADVYDDDLLIFSGVFKLIETNHTFKGRVFGATAGLFDLLKGVSLQDLDLSAFNHTYTAANVNARRQNTTGVVYPNINYGLWTGETLPGSGTAFTDFYPAVYIDNILDAACTLAGYTYTKLGSDMIIPFCLKDFQQTTSVEGTAVKTTDDILLVAGSEIPIPYDNITSDPLSLFTYTTVGADRTTISMNKGVYEISGTIIYSADAGNIDDINIGAYLDSGIFYSNILTVSPGDSGTYNFTITVDQTSTSNFNFRLAIDGNTTGDSITISSGSTLVLDSGLRQILANATIPIADTLPDLDVVEVFKYMAARENALMIGDNQARTFEFIRFADIAGDLSRVLDLSEKVIDDNEVRELFHLEQYAQNNYLQFKIQPNDDPTRNANALGRGNVTVSDGALIPSKVMYGAPFCRTAISESFSNMSAMPFIPRYSDSTVDYREPDIDPDFRVLKSEINDSQSVRISGTTAPATQCNPVFQTFATEVTNNYGAFLTALDKLKVIELDLQLTNADIQQFDVTRPVYLYDSYWFVLKIEQFKVGGYAPTKVRLLRLY